MRKVVSLYLPTWPTDRVRRRLGKAAPPVETPLVLIGRSGRQRAVTASDRAGQRHGIAPGMPATQAQALVAGLVAHDADPKGDVDDLERLAVWALRLYSPLVAADPPDGLFIDATGAAHLFGGERQLLEDMVGRLADVSTSARAAMAPTYGAAHALARFCASSSIVSEDGLAAALAELPIAALRLPIDIVAGLRALGFERIGELSATPRAPITLRFGPEIGRRLDQAFGRTAEPIETVEPPELVSVRRNFAEPIGAAETLARYTGILVAELCSALEAKGQGAVRLDLLFYRVDNRFESIRIGMAKPGRDPKRLTRLLCDQIEKVDPGFGVELMVLRAPCAEPLNMKQTVSTLGETAEPDVSELIDTLTNRLGAGRLYQAVAVESDLPERSVAYAAPLADAPLTDWPLQWPRPTRLLLRPEPIQTVALLPDQPPVSFTWRGICRRVKRADGPERVFGEWWKRDAEQDSVRDYFRVEDDAGERFWLFRAGDGEDLSTGSQGWFLHGVFG